MAALLSDGIEAYMHSVAQDEPTEKEVSEAQAWVETRNYSYVFSFDVVCECLGIDPEYLREGIFRYASELSEKQQEQQEAEHRPWRRIRRPRK